MNEADIARGWVHDEIQEDTTSMEEKLVAINERLVMAEQTRRCALYMCLTADVVDGKCKFCGSKSLPCEHPKESWCTTCRAS